MSPWYDAPAPPLQEQHKRLVALRHLISRDIPCILWGEDALSFAHNVPTALFDQKILLPDELLHKASNVLQEGRYVPAHPARDYIERNGPRKGENPFPAGIRLQHLDIPENDPWKLEPLPGFILLLPQSYFGLDVQSIQRFQSLSADIEPSNSKILIPKYNTFLECLVHFHIYPPAGLEVPHFRGYAKIGIFISYLIQYRIKEDRDSPNEQRTLTVIEEIIGELETEEARWYFDRYLRHCEAPSWEDMAELCQQKTIKAS